MKIAIVSGGIKSNISNASAKYVLADLDFLQKVNNKNTYIKHIEIDDQNDHGKVFGIDISKEKVLPYVDLLIDLSHHKHKIHHDYSKKVGVHLLFKKNISRIDMKSMVSQIGMNVNDHIIVRGDQFDKYHLTRSLHLPSVIKSINDIVPTFIGHNHKDIFEYLEDNHKKDTFIIENYLKGKVFTCVFIKNFRGQSIYNTSIFEHLNSKDNIDNRFVIAKYLGDNIKDKIIEIGNQILPIADANICEINFIINVNSSQSTAMPKIIINNCIFTPRYFPGAAFYEILNAHGINMLELAENFRER